MVFVLKLLDRARTRVIKCVDFNSSAKYLDPQGLPKLVNGTRKDYRMQGVLHGCGAVGQVVPRYWKAV